ncbi:MULTISPECIES: DNA-methyltransferase [Leptospira]|uniref:DNA-methyltransferase n=1 Tax=Leptospira TaxID=171 RepID=UPI000774904D|nr:MULTISPECIES: site-specific DNA-methyltransferase [Leptospira]UML82214.1 site-specific DNA-methyltransferase [Leptospira kirschneri]UML82282.1 site-specific DNA-methyltransferase [Leptospira kirschneri]UMQ56357.1 site-specific DNA-methyltransferase [Leptospira interrogans]
MTTDITTDLYLDDCLDRLPKIPDESIRLILADLPYGTTRCKWDKTLPLEFLWREYERIIIDNGAIILTASQPFTTALINSNPRLFRYELIWYKSKASGFLNAKKKPQKSHENILIFYKKPPVYNPQTYKINPIYQRKGVKLRKSHKPESLFKLSNSDMNQYRYIDDGTRLPDSVLCFASEFQKGMHPTQKPVALMDFLIRSYSNISDTVLDNCMGSGTTGVACIRAGRNFVGIEKDKDIFDVASRRIEIAHTIHKLNSLPSLFR